MKRLLFPFFLVILGFSFLYSYENIHHSNQRLIRCEPTSNRLQIGVNINWFDSEYDIIAEYKIIEAKI
jgi:hypothetical protein